MKTKTILLSTFCASIVQTQAASTVVELEGVGSYKIESATIGTTSGPTTSGVGTTVATYTYTVSGLDIAEDSTANDSFTFTLSVTAGGTATEVLNNTYDAGARDFNGWGTEVRAGADPTNPDLLLGHSLAFAITSSSVILGDGGPATITFDGISAFRHRNLQANDIGTITLADSTTLTAGNSASPNFGQLQDFGATALTDSFTILSGGTDVDGFKVMRLNMQFTLDAIPEPSSTALLGLGGLVLTLRRRR